MIHPAFWPGGQPASPGLLASGRKQRLVAGHQHEWHGKQCCEVTELGEVVKFFICQNNSTALSPFRCTQSKNFFLRAIAGIDWEAFDQRRYQIPHWGLQSS